MSLRDYRAAEAQQAVRDLPAAPLSRRVPAMVEFWQFLSGLPPGSAPPELPGRAFAKAVAHLGMGGPGGVLALPLLVHNRYVRDTVSLMRRQLVGWPDGTAIHVK
jgi:hypothetical protein